MISNGDSIGYENKKDFRSIVLKEVLGILKTKTGIEIVKFAKKANKTAVPSTLDSEAEEITDILIKKKFNDLNKISPVDKKVIKPLFLFLDEEVLLYAKLRNLKFSKKIEKKNKLSDFIDSLEKKHPEIKRAIVNSYLKIR
jgi:tRNA(Ile)-lysidine synthase TilS/MesJ